MTSTIDTQAALEYFKRNDTTMYTLLKYCLGCEKFTVPVALKESKYFESIVYSIIGQQISTKAADAVRSRVKATLGAVTPQSVSEIDVHELRSCGVSPQKIKYLKYNAEHWHEIPTGNFIHLNEGEIVESLTTLYGVGKWTAEMFCIFTLARPNVFSYGDLGLTQSLYHYYKFHPHYTRKISSTVDNWTPHQSAASLALWYARDSNFDLIK